MSNPIAKKIDYIQVNTRMTGKEIAQLLGTTPETVSRWKGGKSDPQQRALESLLHLEWLTTQLSELYPPHDAHLWLFSHHKQFDGRRAVDLIQAGEGKKVLAVIEQLKSGAFI